MIRIPQLPLCQLIETLGLRAEEIQLVLTFLLLGVESRLRAVVVGATRSRLAVGVAAASEDPAQEPHAGSLRAVANEPAILD